MGLKKILKRAHKASMAVGTLLLLVVVDAAFASLTGEGATILHKAGNMISKIGALLAAAGIAWGALIGGYHYIKGDTDRAISHIQGGSIGALIAGGAWGLATWLMS